MKPHKFEIIGGAFLFFLSIILSFVLDQPELIKVGLLGMCILWIVDLQKTVYRKEEK